MADDPERPVFDHPRPPWNRWTSPAILIAPDGNVVFDGEAEAIGVPPFKNKAHAMSSWADVGWTACVAVLMLGVVWLTR